MSHLSDDALYGELEHRLVELGLSEDRARKLTAAIRARDDARASALEEVARHLGGKLDRLADIMEHLDNAPPGTAPAHITQHGHHPVQSAEHELAHLREVEEVGESAATPLILWGKAAVIAVPVVIVVIGLTFLAYYLARDSGSDTASTRPARAATSAAAPWSRQNGDLANTRFVHESPISSANVSKLGVGWTMPLTSGGSYGTFAANPVTDAHGTVYLQDLASNVTAVDLKSGRVRWRHHYNAEDLGPNGVTVAGGVVYGATSTFAFALDANTGKELWRNTTLIPKSAQKGGGALATGFGIDIQPQVADGRVYLSTAALPGGGIVYALDAMTGKTLWSFQTVTDPLAKKIISGGAWNAPAIGPDGTVYVGVANMYEPYSVAVSHPGKRLYTDSTVALDGRTGKLKWYFQAIPNDFHDWDMQLSPILAHTAGRSLVIDSGKMGYVYAMDAATGKLVWKTKVGVHNGRDRDPFLALQHKLPPLKFPLTVEPGDVGGVETNMAVADGVVYVPIVDLPSIWKRPNSGLGTAPFAAAKGEMVALELQTGRILWDTKLPQMALGGATVVNDLVFTTTFDGRLIAFNRKKGSIAWNEKLPAFTNAPIAIVGKTVVAAASFPGGAGQTAEMIGFRLGAHGSFAPAAPAHKASQAAAGAADGSVLFTQNCASCHTLAAAHASGAVGPNLDQLKPSKAVVVRQVTNGGGGMPAFGGRLSPTQIEAVAAYVATSSGRR